MVIKTNKLINSCISLFVLSRMIHKSQLSLLKLGQIDLCNDKPSYSNPSTIHTYSLGLWEPLVNIDFCRLWYVIIYIFLHQVLVYSNLM